MERRPGPESTSAWKARVARIATGALAISTLESCDDAVKIEKPKIVEVGQDAEPLAQIHSGDWQMESRAVGTIRVDNKHGKTLSHFLKGSFATRDWFAPLPAVDQQAAIDGFIKMVRDLNPGINIDDWNAVNGQFLQFPVDVEMIPRPTKVLTKTEGGYSRLQDLAEADGFPVSEAGAQHRMYKDALKNTVELPASDLYYRDQAGSEDSPARLEQDVVDRMLAMGKDYTASKFGPKSGWRFTLTDIMRNPAAQAKRHLDGFSTTTHSTGRSFDLSDGRFLDADDNVVTWSKFVDGKAKGPSEYAKLIEAEMRPKLIEIAMENGFFPYIEPGHWHLYAPRERHADLRDWLVVSTPEQVKPPVVEKPVSPNETVDENLTHVLERIATLPTPDTIDHSNQRMKEVDEAVYLAFMKDPAKPVQQAERPYLSILKFAALDKTQTAEKRKTLRATIDQLKPIISSTTQSEASRTKARALLQGRLKQELIDILRAMPNEQVVKLGVFEGMTIHNTNEHPMHDLDGVWKHKATAGPTKVKGKGKARKVIQLPVLKEVALLAPPTQKQLGGKDGKLTMHEWLDHQERALKLFSDNADRFGFRKDVCKYLTPSVMLSIIHAEFFSELDAETFVQLSPIFFETYNIAYGPSLNDDLYSAGLVQMTADTFTKIQTNHKTKLAELLAEHPGAFVIPSKQTGSKAYKGYNASEFASAMVTNLDSQLFYNSFVLANNTAAALDIFASDEPSRVAWMHASDAVRTEFLAVVAPMGIHRPGSLQVAARAEVKAGVTSISTVADGLPTHNTKGHADRGGERGHETILYLLSLAEK